MTEWERTGNTVIVIKHSRNEEYFLPYPTACLPAQKLWDLIQKQASSQPNVIRNWNRLII